MSKNEEHILIRNYAGKWEKHQKTEELISSNIYSLNSSDYVQEYSVEEYIAIKVNHNSTGIKVRKRSAEDEIQVESDIPRSSTQNIQPSSFQEYLENIEECRMNLLKNLVFINETAIQQQKLSIACDGGAIDGIKGSYGLVIATDEDTVATVKNSIPGIFGKIVSYRSEGYGILASVYFIAKWLEYCKLQHQEWTESVTILCDNEAMVKTINKYGYRPRSIRQQADSDSDIVEEILALLREIRQTKTQIEVIHIKGHQDRNKNAELTPQAELNIIADKLATEGLRLSSPEYYQMPQTTALLRINNKVIMSKRKQTMRDTYQSIFMREYYQEKYGWNDATMESIWWQIFESAIPAFSANEQTTLYKYIHRRLPCNIREYTYYEYKSPICSTCKIEIETQNHVLQCTGCDKRHKLKKNYLLSVYNIMEKLNTNDELARVIVMCISAWLCGQEIPRFKDISTGELSGLEEAYNDQAKIGWEHMLRGRWSIKWGNIYNISKKTRESSQPNLSAEKWGKDIIVLTWRFALDLWRSRNEDEHGTVEDAVNIAKGKLIQKIKWLHKTSEVNSAIFGDNISQAELEKIPLANLVMMETQLNTKKNDHPSGGQGESGT
jgi:hypothetical protein